MTGTTNGTPPGTEHGTDQGGRHRRQPGEWRVWRTGRRLVIRRRAWPTRFVFGGTSFRTFEEARLHVLIQQEIVFKRETQADYVLASR